MLNLFKKRRERQVLSFSMGLLMLFWGHRQSAEMINIHVIYVPSFLRILLVKYRDIERFYASQKENGQNSIDVAECFVVIENALWYGL